MLLAVLGAHPSLPRTEIPRKRNPEAVGQHRRNVEKDDGSNFACASVFESTISIRRLRLSRTRELSGPIHIGTLGAEVAAQA